MADDEVHKKTDHALTILDALADKWAAEVNLTSMIKNAVSPMGLNRNAPGEVVAQFQHRMEVQIDAIARQAFIEGAYRAITGSQDERKAQGLVVVPKEPTDAQVINALDWALEWMRQHKVDGLSPFKDYPPVGETTRGMYRAMIVAANQ
jgi:hypothetical protein